MVDFGKQDSKRGPKSRRSTESYVFGTYDDAVIMLQLAIGAALSGAALRIGLTRDSGALALGVYNGDDYGTEYVRPSEDLGHQVREISLAWGIPLAYWDDEAQRWAVG